MRKHDNPGANFNIQNETVLQRVDYDSFDDKKPFRSPKSSQGCCSWKQQPVQLDIDIEVNESIQVLLNSSNSSDTDLIDVTLIRETPSFPETTVSLGKPEIKRFLEMVSRKPVTHNYTKNAKVERPRTEHRRSIHQPSNLNTTDEDCELFDSGSCGFQDEANFESIYTDSTEKPDNKKPNYYPYKRNEKVYASPDMFTKLKSSLACQHNRKYSLDDQKPGTPCLCQHCGMIGVLIESQKRPFIPHNMPPETTRHRSRSAQRKERKTRTADQDYSLRFHQENYNTTEMLPQDTLFEDLLTKLKSLEARVLAQEEKAVGKDYFQYVIRKMLSQYITKMVQSELPDNVKNSATQYSRIFLGNPDLHQTSIQQRRHRQLSRSSGKTSSDQYIKDLNSDRNGRTERMHNKNDAAQNYKPETDRQAKPKNVRYYDADCSNCKKKHWKDIHTEQDLKNRILSLIEGEVCWKKQKESNRQFEIEKAAANNEIKVESFQNTITLPHVIQSGRTLAEPQESQHEKDRTMTTSTLKDLLDNMSSQIYEDLVKSKSDRPTSPSSKPKQSKYNNVQKALDDTLFKRNIEASKKREIESVQNSKKDKEKAKNMNIKSGESPVPQMDRFRTPRETLDIDSLNLNSDSWGESSNSEYIKPKRRQNIQTPENKINQKDSLAYKVEYLRGLARSKNIAENDLWQSIWRQTKNRFKSKDDILTISIPSRKHMKRPIELELTWSDLKQIMRSTRSKSPHQVSSSDLLHNQKKSREYNVNHKEYTRKHHSYKQRAKSLR